MTSPNVASRGPAEIKRQKTKFKAQLRQSRREMVSGESHYFLGRRYRLRVVLQDGPAKVIVRNSSIIELRISQGKDPSQGERILQRWYRQQLNEPIPPLLEKWQRALGVQVAECSVKKMKTKWGSCSVEAGRIWLNLELAKKAPQCLEYIVAHEMIHLIERRHNERNTALMNKFIPNWRLIREELNSAPLAHVTWGY